MSCGVPQRPSGIFVEMRCFTAGSSALPYAVSIQPGPITFTRIRGATECASARLKEYTPPFAAQNTWAYSLVIPPPSTWSQDMFRMTPPETGGWASINSTAFQEASTVPRRSTARSRSSFSARDRRGAGARGGGGAPPVSPPPPPPPPPPPRRPRPPPPPPPPPPPRAAPPPPPPPRRPP